jgi:hypothetical protein
MAARPAGHGRAAGNRGACWREVRMAGGHQGSNGGRTATDGKEPRMLPVPLIFTSSWASGINSYAVVLLLGLYGRFGHVAGIPPLLEKPGVLAAAALGFGCQFLAGKLPYLDSVWDLVHTIIRPVMAGAVAVLMAHHAHGSPALTVAAALLGGGTALASHGVKTGVRMGINVSPEPVSTILASLAEDLGVTGVMSFAVFHPVPAAIIAACLLAAGVVLVMLLASRIRRARRRRRERRLRTQAVAMEPGRSP